MPSSIHKCTPLTHSKHTQHQSSKYTTHQELQSCQCTCYSTHRGLSPYIGYTLAITQAIRLQPHPTPQHHSCLQHAIRLVGPHAPMPRATACQAMQNAACSSDKKHNQHTVTVHKKATHVPWCTGRGSQHTARDHHPQGKKGLQAPNPKPHSKVHPARIEHATHRRQECLRGACPLRHVTCC